MKNYKLILGFLLSSQSAFAVTDQINLAEKYYLKTNSVFQVESMLPTQISNVLVDKRIISDPSEGFVDLGKDIYPGHKHKNFSLLQKQWNLPETGVYEKSFEKQIKKLQKEAGLTPTGIVDKNTWYALYEQPLEWRVSTVSKAIQNWKNIVTKHASHKSPQMIVVNIPSMMLYFYEQKEDDTYELLLESKVVVGRKKTQTPLNDFDIISLKYNPTWTPTKNILKRNLYKDGALNVKWLEDHGLLLLDENGEVRPYEDLTTLEKAKFVQPSGDANALGNLKFETTSKEDIYMHDTNERHLFNYNTRTYSSGCIRVQNYVGLASLLAGKNEEYVNKNIAKGEMFFQRVQRVPVYFDYSQVRFLDDNKLRFYADVYDKNKK